MDAEEFVDAVKKVVREAAIEDSLSLLAHPPGRRPPLRLGEAAKWYGSLDENQRQLLAHVIGEAVDSAVFGFLCVLDGVRAVESGGVKGRFELRYVGETSILLNAEQGDMLHDLYNARSAVSR